MAGVFGLVWVFGPWIRKAALSKCPGDTCNRRDFSTEKRIYLPGFSKMPDQILHPLMLVLAFSSKHDIIFT